MDFLRVKGKNFIVSGVSNKKSVAFHSAKTLLENEANVIFTVQSEEHKGRVEKLFPGMDIYIVDAYNEESIHSFASEIKQKDILVSGFLHSIAFANYSEGIKPFHETKWEDYAEAIKISSFSLVNFSNALKESLSEDASIVTVSISNLKATTYGYMGPIKANLDSTVHFLAKSFSKFSKIRFNAISSGPLKTSASAGIPGYIDNYLFSEAMTLRKEALKTSEVADSICYFLSPRSSGVNGTNLVVDCGMSVNGFDEEIVRKFSL